MLEQQENSNITSTTVPETTAPVETSTPQTTGSRLINQISSQSYKIITQYGDMLVIKQGIQLQPHHSAAGCQPSDSQQGSQQRPIIMTFHDLGLNSELQFATFCECEEVKLMLKTFTMIHVNFIGQEFPSQQHQPSQQQQQSQQFRPTTTATPNTATSNTLPDDFKYPNMEQMAESIVDVCAQLRIRSFIAIAVGAGAHIVGNLALLRPDLVDGLFLINPVITSCSITEWLYFKMSAIASNHSIGNWNSGIGGTKDWSILSSPTSLLSSSSSSANQSPSRSHQSANKNQTTTTTTTIDTNHHKHSHGLGFKKLLNAAHLHFPHHHHHHDQKRHDNKDNSSDNEAGSSDLKQVSPQQHSDEQRECSSDAENIDKSDETKSISARLESNMSITASSSSNSSPINKAQHHSGSRLRQLIFSRNIRNTVQQRQIDQLSRTSSASAGSSAGGAGLADIVGHSKHKHNSSTKVKSSDSDDSIGSQRSGGGGGGGGKRPPSEYLMYHHFGPISFQTYRRSSDTPLTTMFHNRDSPSGTPIQQRPLSSGEGTSVNVKLGQQSGANSDGSTTSNSKQNFGQCSPGTPRGRARAVVGHQVAPSSGSIGHDSSNFTQESRGGRCRSGSVCMDSIYLASFENERQRSSYIHSVYKYYFSQINSHNLWLFAQSFAKRKSLNLRKDCGAAAHAAAAAATLGTSICSAFVGMTPGTSLSDSTSISVHHKGSTTRSEVASNKPGSESISSNVPTTKQQQHREIMANDTKADNSSPQQFDGDSSVFSSSFTSETTQDKTPNKQTATKLVESRAIGQRHFASNTNTNAKSKQNCQQPKALVAGTKVKRTFTCQTLIMCSSVQMHRERAFKLMSLLNPLQATWIQTDHLLVLEEKPEKVCQALRLFLQGIGYSMSTYERRLRLSSTTGSAGSADSNNSGPSLSEAKLR